MLKKPKNNCHNDYTSLERHRDYEYLLNKPFAFPSISGKKVLIIGVGGGCDIITAYAFSKMLHQDEKTKVIYSNTKTKIREPLDPVSHHILRVAEKRITLAPKTHTHGTTLIDQSIPRGPDGCPWIIHLPRSGAGLDELAAEIREMEFDLVISIDTGADSIISEATSGPKGRDQRMMNMLNRLGTSYFHVVVSPGCDGETTFTQLTETITEFTASEEYLGCVSILDIVPMMSELARPLKFNRTPNIIAEACSHYFNKLDEDQIFEVPRGLKPKIPIKWLSVALIFNFGASHKHIEI